MDHLIDLFQLLYAPAATGEGKGPDIVEAGTHPSWGAALEAARRRAPGSGHALIVAPRIMTHRDLRDEVSWAVGDPGLEGTEWSALMSDGVDITDRWCDAGNYPDDPALPANVPLRLAAAADPAVTIVRTDVLAHIGDDVATAPDLVRWGLASGRPVYLSGRVRFSADRERGHTAAGIRPAPQPELRTVRHDPSLTIVVRTSQHRGPLLRRNLRALSRQMDDGVDVVITQPERSADLETIIDQLPRPFRPTVLGVPDTGRPHRTDALLAAIASAPGDYVWFIDDDDWVAEHGVSRVRSAVHAHDRPVLVGAVESHREVWDGDHLETSHTIRRYLPGEWFRAFGGWNHLPNCAVIMPTGLARQRLSQVPLGSDLGEDFALQLLLYTAPGVAVTVLEDTVAHVSVRDGVDNTVTMDDRLPWLRDIGSHVSVLSRDQAASTASPWALGRAVRQIPYPASTGDEPAPDHDDPSPPSGPAPRGPKGRLRRRLGGR